MSVIFPPLRGKEWLMNTGKTIFSQVIDHLPPHTLRHCVQRYRGHYKVKSFSCLDQYLCMAFAQLTYRESLRDIEACLRAQGAKLYHMGFRGRGGRLRIKGTPWIKGTPSLLSHRLRPIDR